MEGSLLKANGSYTDGLKVVPVAFGVISSADEDSSDSLSEPVAKKRDMVGGSSQPAKIKRPLIKGGPFVKHKCIGGDNMVNALH